MFAFLYVKVNSICKGEICEEIIFLLFSEKMLLSTFLFRLKTNYLEKMRGYPHFFLLIHPKQPKKNKMAFVGILVQIKLLFGPLVIQLVWYIVKQLFT